MSLAGLAWRLLGTALSPALPWHLRRRAAAGKEVPERLPERFGLAAARPPGRLFWLHAASVGETISLLPLIEALAARDPALHLLVTTGTVTSAEVLARRLPLSLAARVTHRFLPLDVPAWVARFLDGWRPDAAALVESELWPNLLAAARARGLPMALVNARISPRSLAGWRRAPRLAAEILGGFRQIFARSAADAAALRALGAAAPLVWGDLKWAAPPLPADPAALALLRQAIGDRPVLLGASLHPGEDSLLLAAAARLRPRLPRLLTILVPRHPARGPAFATAAAATGLATARRAADQPLRPDTSAYVADTLNELGLFYRVASVALVGGTLVPHGGQNPLEPARLGCPILLGPHTWNFVEPVARLFAAGGARPVAPDPVALANVAGDVLTTPTVRRGLADAAAGVAAGEADLPDRVALALLDMLPAP
jgi:3-deoxy-D-manno-octulosonic-acid transferase